MNDRGHDQIGRWVGSEEVVRWKSILEYCAL